MKYSIIIPLYNRPAEIDELLDSLTKQSFKDFEIIVVEDGSTIPSKHIIDKYLHQLTIAYYRKQNEGPGPARNYGAKKANGDYFIFFDSDCVIPEHYFKSVNDFLLTDYKDAYGGADMAHKSFSNIQKAINYSMTSFLTTGGIRGRKSSLEKFHPRSYNMGISREIFEKLGGFSRMRFGEDIDMSIRINKENYSTCLIQNAGVFHKRRTNLRQFFRQIINSGIARINLFKLHPHSLKVVHVLPAIYTLGLIILLILSICIHPFFILPWLFYLTIVFFHSLLATKNIFVALLSILTSQVQLIAYGIGFIYALFQSFILKKSVPKAFSRNLYQ
ncbi:MAG: glycosyltransferase [Bacteroidales bacterium]|jgi:glycosyltransferase involved in cell wall biosynthesis|nr:glycosyltransferase [Bacteroidales bacterium]